MRGGLPHSGHRERRLGGRAGRCRAGLGGGVRGGERAGAVVLLCGDQKYLPAKMLKHNAATSIARSICSPMAEPVQQRYKVATKKLHARRDLPLQNRLVTESFHIAFQIANNGSGAAEDLKLLATHCLQAIAARQRILLRTQQLDSSCSAGVRNGGARHRGAAGGAPAGRSGHTIDWQQRCAGLAKLAGAQR